MRRRGTRQGIERRLQRGRMAGLNAAKHRSSAVWVRLHLHRKFIEALESRRYASAQPTWADFVDWLTGLINDYLDMKSLNDGSNIKRLGKLLERLSDLDSIGVKPSISH